MSLPEGAALAARIVAKTSEYLDTPSVTGAEAPFLDQLARDFSRLGREVTRSDGICAVAARRADAPVVIAHADRHGGIVTADRMVAPAPKDPDAEPSYETVGTLAERMVGEEVYAYDAESGDRLAYAELATAETGEDGAPYFTLTWQDGFKAGAAVALARPLDRSQPGYVSGWLDNAISIAAANIAVASGADAHFVFVGGKRSGEAAERVRAWAAGAGLSGARFVCLSTSAFDDSAASQAGAVVLRRRDADASFADTAVRRIEDAAERAAAPIIFKDAFIESENAARQRRGEAARPLGSTLAGRLTSLTRGECAGASLQVPVFNRNTSRETTTPRALTAFARTLFQLCSP